MYGTSSMTPVYPKPSKAINFVQPNKDQIDCFEGGQWCGLLEKESGGQWIVSKAERGGEAIDLSMGTKFADGRYFFGGSLAEAKEAFLYEMDASS